MITKVLQNSELYFTYSNSYMYLQTICNVLSSLKT